MVGHLSTGGTGKTPHTEYLIRILRDKYRLATLSRGYGRKSKGFILADAGSDASLIGDEPCQYHFKFPDITVSVCENRVEGIRMINELQPETEVIIMDDGFQHRAADPGFKILLTPFSKPFTRDLLLPAGNLREPVSGYKRSDCIIITRCPDNLSEKTKQHLINEIAPVKNQKLFFSSLRYLKPVLFTGESSDVHLDFSKTHALLFSGIADATSFEIYAGSVFASTDCIRFSDHHTYIKSDLVKIINRFHAIPAENKILLTTEKDIMRLRGTEFSDLFQKVPFYYLPVEVYFHDREGFDKMISDFLLTFTKH